MNTFTGELAADVAFTHPPAIPVALILGYNGAARATVPEVANWARPFLMGFESSTTRAYAGGPAGGADSDWSCGVYDAWGYPRTCGSWFCAADSPSTDQAFVPNIMDYGHDYAVHQIAGGRTGPLTVYGNPTAVEAAAAGVRAAGLTALRWGVGTWGYGEGRGANQPPASANVELLQSGNSAGPADGTDLDWLYTSVAAFMPLGGPTATPVPEEDDDMATIFIAPGPFGDYAVLAQGNAQLKSFASDGRPAEFGVPATAVDWNSLPGRGYPYKFLDTEAGVALLDSFKPAAATIELTEAQLTKIADGIKIPVGHTFTFTGSGSAA